MIRVGDPVPGRAARRVREGDGEVCLAGGRPVTCRTRRSRRISAVTQLCAAGLLVVATPAPAAAPNFLRDLSVVARSSPLNSATPKTLAFACPAGTVSLGKAAFVSPALANLGLFSAANNNVASATETDSESASWRLNAREFCVAITSTAPPVGGAAPYVKAVQIVRNQGAQNSQATKSVTARCPAGKTAISGGGRHLPGSLDVAFTATQRVNANRAWRVAAHEVDATSASWRLQASVICANVTTETATSDYATNVDTASAISELVSGPLNSASVAVKCPGDRRAVGGGAAVFDASNGQRPPSDAVLVISEPLADGWLADARATDPSTQTFRVFAFAVCAELNGGPPA